MHFLFQLDSIWSSKYFDLIEMDSWPFENGVTIGFGNRRMCPPQDLVQILRDFLFYLWKTEKYQKILL